MPQRGAFWTTSRYSADRAAGGDCCCRGGQIRDGKLSSEHVYWDQASVLVQIGKLDPAGLPIAGVEVARKVLDRRLPSNQLMAREWCRGEGKPI